MPSRWPCLVFVFVCLVSYGAAQAQLNPALDASVTDLPAAPSAEVEPLVMRPLPPLHSEHRFWDKQNTSLLVVHAGLETADFFLTHDAIASGGRELNPIARPLVKMGTGGQIAFFAGGTLATMGVSYLLHKTHHHRLERMVEWYSIADSSWGVSYNLAHRGDHPPSSISAPVQAPTTP